VVFVGGNHWVHVVVGFVLMSLGLVEFVGGNHWVVVLVGFLLMDLGLVVVERNSYIIYTNI
jgi:hypothetical protein